MTFSCIYGGEDYDARREIRGWDTAGLRRSAWQPAVVTEGPGGRLVSQSAPPIKVLREYQAVKRTQPRPGVYGLRPRPELRHMPRLAVKGLAGEQVG